MDFRPVFNIAEICYQQGVEDVIISPGSRNAPLTIAFVRHPYLKTYPVSDERSAGFIGLGMAQKTKKPVVLISTSGSAGLNFYPAIAEAYFRQLPLIVLTADRPPEWIDQQDGQTVRQHNVFGAHVKASFQTPADFSGGDGQWHHGRIISDALIMALDGHRGPVHINIPFREPFYPEKNQEFKVSEPKPIIKYSSRHTLSDLNWVELINEWKQCTNKLIIGGQGDLEAELIDILNLFHNEKRVPVIGDIISNLHYTNGLVSLHELFLGALSAAQKDELKPDLLITFGQSVLSKNLKLLLRKFKPRAHWHIQADGDTADTFQSLTRIIPADPLTFLTSIKDIATKAPATYQQKWQQHQKTAKSLVSDFHLNRPFNEFSAVHTILENLPMGCDIHLANSMPVRWANLYGLDQTHPQIEIFANRGTSGIDGCTSTALGSAIKSAKTTLLLTGDMAFFYDRNAFWNNLVPDNFRVIVLNNHGGGIFDIIDGPPEQPEHGQYFLTHQPLRAKALAEEYGLKYYHCQSLEGLSKGLSKFWIRDGSAKILEIESSIKINTQTFKEFKKQANALWS
jgi:2-succinyl-5-enolpyruvyl-6-hydroxy-3-cyclohexene-1-carboxylate synthase